jgi:hypothetical protein
VQQLQACLLGVCYCCYDEFSGDVHVLSPYAYLQRFSA